MKQLPLAEFIPLMALLTALDAMSIDMMLPALPAIGRDLHLATANDAQLIVSTMFLGFGIGTLIGGPLSDSIGRKPAILWGLALYMIGCVAALLATTFPLMLGARVLQGVGASIPLVVMTALVRDLYEGATMARVMSFIGAVFIVVPVLAPLIGQGVLLVAHWRAIFGVFLVLAVPCSVWFIIRQPETLRVDKRVPFSFRRIARAGLRVCRNRLVMGYTLAQGLLFGAFLGYLSSAQQIFQDIYRAGPYFVLLFSCLSMAIGSALFVNGMLVERLGMARLTFAGFAGVALLSAVFLLVHTRFPGAMPLLVLMLYLSLTLFCVGLLFGNLNALTMQPLGHVAGIGAAVVGSLSTLISVPLGAVVGREFDGTVVPLMTGFAVLGGLALPLAIWAEAGRVELAR